MSFTAQIEPGGRIALPADMLTNLQLHEGDDVLLEDVGRNGQPALSVQAAPGGALIEEDGLLVWESPGPYTPGLERQVLEAIWKERDLMALGTMAETLD